MRDIYLKYEDKPIVSYLFILICSVVYFFEFLSSRSTTIDSQTLLNFGAKQHDLIMSGQYYRLVAPIFVHLDLMHILTNMISILAVGGLAEMVVSKYSYIKILILGGIMGNVLGVLLSKGTIAAGASTSIFAVMGMFAYFYLFSNNEQLRRAAKMIVGIAIVNIVLTSAGTDLVGHLGGFLGGFILAPTLTMYREEPVPLLRRIIFDLVYVGLIIFCLRVA